MVEQRNDSTRTIVFGTRKSSLALWQTHHVIDLLKTAHPGLDFRIETFESEGDRNTEQPLPEIGGKGLFTSRLERALREGVVDVAVHSLKDLPIDDTPDLTLGAITSRADVRDVLVSREGWTLETLPSGSVIGTSSIRRQGQLLRIRPDLVIKPIRGNVETRVRKVAGGDYDATVLAFAGVDRLGLMDSVTERLSLDTMLPAPGQGALAVQCRADDKTAMAMLQSIDDPEVRGAVTAERLFLKWLGGGCSSPVGAYATTRNGKQEIFMTGLVASGDGSRSVRVEGSDGDPEALAKRLASEAIENGARELLSEETPTGGVLPLDKRRIVVTRAANQAGEMCEALSRLGAIPVPFATIRVEPINDEDRMVRTIESVAGRDWVVFTSVNGVAAFCSMLPDGVDPGQLFANTHVAAVGPTTAAALDRRGVTPGFVPKEFTGDAIAREIGDVEGKNFLLLRAEKAGRDIVEVLEKRGATVEDIPVYRTVREEVDPKRFAELDKGVDVIVYTSGSTARNFVAAYKESGRDTSFLTNTLAACIGPVTADTARGLGLNVGVIAEEHTTNGLLDALVRYFSEGESR